MKRRYDTSFFLTILPPASSPSPTPSASGSTTPTHQDHVATADNGETISADWLTPLEAISRTLAHTSSLQSRTGPPPESIILFPPQFYLLAELVKAKSWKDLVDPRLQDLGGNPLVHARPIRAFEPEIQRVVDSTGASRAATVLYGDPEHSATDRSQSRAEDRHRTYILMRVEPKDKDEDEKWKKSPPLGLTVMGVERKGMGRLLGDGWEDMSEGDVGSGEKAKL